MTKEKEENNDLFQLAQVATMGENILVDTDDIENPDGAGAGNGNPDENDGVVDVTDELNIDENGEPIVVDKKPNEETETEKAARLEKERPENKDTGNAGEKPESEVTPKNFSPFAAAIKESGIIPTLDLDEFTKLEKSDEQAQFLIDSMEKFIEDRIAEEAANVSPEIEYLIKNYRKGVPLKEILDVQEFNYTINSIKDADVKKEDNKELRADIMREYYRLTAPTMKKEKVDKIIADAQEKGEDVDEAIGYLGEMKEMGKKEEVAMEKRAELKRQEDAQNFDKWKKEIKGVIDTTEEILPGIKLTKKQQETVYNNLIRPVGEKKLPDGRKIPMSKAMQVREIDPNLFDIRLNALIEMGYFDKTVDKNKILARQKTAAVSELEKQLERTKGGDAGKQAVKDNKEEIESKDFVTSLGHAVKNLKR